MGNDNKLYEAPFRIGRTPEWWDSQAVSAQVVGILAAELFGVSVQYVPCEDDGECFFGVSGCTGWRDTTCSIALGEAEARAAFEAGEKDKPDPLPDIMYMPELYPNNLEAEVFDGTGASSEVVQSRSIGPLGYFSKDGIYVHRGVVDAAWDLYGANLMSWRSWSLPSVQSIIHPPQVFIDDGVELAHPGCDDSDGEELRRADAASIGFVCREGWWLNRPCADLGDAWKTSCIVFVEDDWSYDKLGVWRLLSDSVAPVARLVATNDAWWEAVYYMQYNATFYWWLPDATFGMLRPERIAFREVEEAATDIALKVVWQPALEADESVQHLLEHMSLKPTGVMEMLHTVAAAFEQDIYPTRDEGDPFYQKIACDWLRANEEIWSQWVPGPKSCSQGHYFDEASRKCEPCAAGTRAARDARTGAIYCERCLAGQYAPVAGALKCLVCPVGSVAASPGSAECEACPPGMFQPLAGMTQCRNCSAGSVSANAGSAECLHCAPGSSAPEGTTMCEICEAGTYASTAGAPECTPCAGDLVTLGRGAKSVEQCVCPARTLLAEVGTKCVPCPSYLDCQPGSEMLEFVAGNSTFLNLRPGFMSKASEPKRAFRCLLTAACPGGAPGTCSAHRVPGVVACSICQAGRYEDKGSGECIACTISDVVIFAVFSVAVVIGLIVLVLVGSRDMRKQTHDGLLVVSLAGVAFVAVQVLSVLTSLEIDWRNPIEEVLALARALSFDLDGLRLACAISASPQMLLGFRFIVAIGCAPVVFLALWLKRRRMPELELRVEFTNAMGMVVSTLFITVVLACTSPLMCYQHPEGSGSSVRSTPSVLCWEGDEHLSLVVQSVVYLCAIPLPFFAATVLTTLRLPRWTASNTPGSLRRLKESRFLFVRFAPERYYYGIIFQARSLLLCLVPIVFTSLALQVLSLGILMLTFGVVQQQLNPWRKRFVNVVDGAVNSLIVALLLCGAMLSERLQVHVNSVVFLGAATLFACFLLLLSSVLWALIGYLRVRPYYQFFICHHKQHAQAQARWLKIQLHAQTGRSVFIDSDDLTELDILFDIVKRNVRTLIAYASRELLMRPWCAGELTTALASRVGLVFVSSPSFVEPTEEQLDDLENYIDWAGCPLVRYGILPQDISEAYRELLDPCGPAKRVDMDTESASGTRLSKMARGVLAACTARLATDLKATRSHGLMSAFVSGDEASDGTRRPAALVARPDTVVISSLPGCDESSAAAGVLVSNIQADLLAFARNGAVLLADAQYHGQPIDDVVANARAIVVLLSPGTLASQAQLRVIVNAAQLQGRDAEDTGLEAPPRSIVPVALPGFVFPGPDYYLEPFAMAWGEASRGAAHRVKLFFRSIAVQLATGASDEVLRAQSRLVMMRVEARASKGQEMMGANSSGSIALALFNPAPLSAVAEAASAEDCSPKGSATGDTSPGTGLASDAEAEFECMEVPWLQDNV